jgi:hypothetical protein
MVSLGRYQYNYWADDWVRGYMGLMHWFSPTGLSIIPGILCLHPAPQRLVVNLCCVCRDRPAHHLVGVVSVVYPPTAVQARVVLPIYPRHGPSGVG